MFQWKYNNQFLSNTHTQTKNATTLLKNKPMCRIKQKANVSTPKTNRHENITKRQIKNNWKNAASQ